MRSENICPFGLLVEGESGASLMDFSVADIETLFEEQQLLVFRGFREMEDDEMISFSERFGKLLEWDFGFVFDLKIDPNPKNQVFKPGRLELHWDGSYLGPEKTPKYSFFQCIEGNTTSGGETLFCDAVRAYYAADEPLRRQFDDAIITYKTERKGHFGGELTWPLVNTLRFGKGSVIRYMEAFNEDNEDINPINVSVNGLEKSASDRFLRKLNEHLYSSQFLYEHYWLSGDFLMFNNSALLHGRRAFKSDTDERRLKRVHIL